MECFFYTIYIMLLKDRYKHILAYFEQHMPQAETELRYENEYQLLVAVILSAQCTDVRVNMVTPALFLQYPSLQHLAQSTPEEVFPFIKSISYPNNKAKHLVGMANMVINDFNGIIPMEVDKLVKLPGVGRKTANVITSVIDMQPNMAVDTHVFRLSNRLGLTNQAKTPLAVEKKLIQHIPQQLIHKAHHWLILHGRYVCTARNPQCNNCGITAYCKYFDKQKKQAAKP